jgi:hypothetical protein
MPLSKLLFWRTILRHSRKMVRQKNRISGDTQRVPGPPTPNFRMLFRQPSDKDGRARPIV